MPEGTGTPLVATPADERSPMISPDGRWLAFVSDRSGNWEVYLTSLAEGAAPRQVSRDGGTEPAWSPEGDELYFRSADLYVVAVGLDASGGLGRPVRLFEDRYAREPFHNTIYGVAPDGRFLMVEAPEAETMTLRVFVGFAEWVRERVAASQ